MIMPMATIITTIIFLGESLRSLFLTLEQNILTRTTLIRLHDFDIMIRG